MHTLHLILVQAEDEEDAITTVISILDSLPEGQWWDWYEVGGRWNDCLDGKNAMPSNHPDFDTILKNINEQQNRTFRELTACATGRTVTEDEIPDTIFGLPVSDKTFTTGRINEQNSGYAATIQEMLHADSLDEARDIPFIDQMAFWHLGKLVKLVTDSWFSDSWYCDIDEWTCDPRKATERDGATFLVAVDFHF